jgi:sulfate adenylyltransferase subunit 1
MPSKISSKIKKIFFGKKEIKKAQKNMSVTITVKDEIDIGRGDWIVGNKNIPVLKSKFNVKVVWMSRAPLINKAKLILKQKTKEISVFVNLILSKYNNEDFSLKSKPNKLEINEIGEVEIISSEPIFFENEIINSPCANMILIDNVNNQTVGACVIGKNE